MWFLVFIFTLTCSALHCLGSESVVLNYQGDENRVVEWVTTTELLLRVDPLDLTDASEAINIGRLFRAASSAVIKNSSVAWIEVAAADPLEAPSQLHAGDLVLESVTLKQVDLGRKTAAADTWISRKINVYFLRFVFLTHAPERRIEIVLLHDGTVVPVAVRPPTKPELERFDRERQTFLFPR